MRRLSREKDTRNIVTVTVTAMVSAIGSARNTAITLFSKKAGRMKDQRDQQDDLAQQRQKDGGFGVARAK